MVKCCPQSVNLAVCLQDTYTENSESCDAFVDAEVIIEELRDKIQDRCRSTPDSHTAVNCSQADVRCVDLT